MNYPKAILAASIMLTLWEALVWSHFIYSPFVPLPSKVFLALFEYLKTSQAILDIWATLSKILVSFLLAVLIGTILGIAIGHFRKLREGLEPGLDFARSIPSIALFPLFMLAFGIGFASTVALAFFVATMIVIVSATYGVKQIKIVRLQLAKKIGIRGKKLFFKFLLPESLPNLFSGYRLAASYCPVLVIMGEIFLGSNEGLGFRLIEAQTRYQIPTLYALILICGLLGYFLNYSLICIERRTIHWQGK